MSWTPTPGACSIGCSINLPRSPADPAGTAPARRSVPDMTAPEKLVAAFNRADINAAFRERILAVLTPEALAAAVIRFAAVFVASQFTPVGWAADLALGLTAVFPDS